VDHGEHNNQKKTFVHTLSFRVGFGLDGMARAGALMLVMIQAVWLSGPSFGVSSLVESIVYDGWCLLRDKAF